jgi:phospholipid/cholesterol/gamma-HCH transport system substrate-binding protein
MESAPCASFLMEREANYTAVGAFVLLIVTMAGLFVYWYAGSGDARDYNRYEIYFEGSVSGLNRGSTVRYLGVEVGRVAAIRIDQRAADRVQVIADIDSHTPISETTLASLSLQGVTGLLYIDLLANAPDARKTPAVPSERYPVIGSVRSNFDLFLSSLPDLVGRASAVLSDQNIESITKTLESIEQGAASLPDTMRDARQVVAELKSTLVDVRAAAAGAREFMDSSGPQLTAAAERFRVLADNLARTTGNLDRLMSDHREDLGLFLRDSLPEMERLLRDSRVAAQEFRELSRSLKADPSQLLYEPSYRGVEKPR